MNITEAIIEARENIVHNFSTEPCVINALLREIDHVSSEQCRLLGIIANERIDEIWDALRLECCATGLSAYRIVMLSREDLNRAMKRLTQPQASPLATVNLGDGKSDVSSLQGRNANELPNA